MCFVALLLPLPVLQSGSIVVLLGLLGLCFLGHLGRTRPPLRFGAFSFPLSMHDPSVWMTISLCLLSAPMSLGRCAGFLVILWGSVNTRKHSDRSSLVVIDGSKTIFPHSSRARMFCCFRLFVSDKLPCPFPGLRGFCLGSVLFIRASASVAQSCGCVQSFSRSSTHAVQLQ